MTAALIIVFVILGAFHRMTHGGKLPKWAAHVVGGGLACGLAMVAPDHLVGGLVGWACWLQMFTPGRDFASSRSLAEVHTPWCFAASCAAMSPLSLLAVPVLVGGYWGLQRWMPDRLRPTEWAEAVLGASVWGFGAAAVLV